VYDPCVHTYTCKCEMIYVCMTYVCMIYVYIPIRVSVCGSCTSHKMVCMMYVCMIYVCMI